MTGYGTLQSLIQFWEALKEGNKPDLVIISYCSGHDMRNTGARAWIKSLVTHSSSAKVLSTVKFPFARLSKNHKELKLVYSPLEYHSVPLAHHSALANYIDHLYNIFLISRNANRDHYVSRLLLNEFSYICKTEGIPFVVAGICSDYATADMLEYLNKKGTPTVDISVDLSIKENNNLPYEEWHPSAFANKKYAHKLQSFLCRMKLINGSTCDY